MSLSTRTSLKKVGFALAAALAAMVAAGHPAIAQEKVLRAVLHADVRTLDPIWTTQTIANIHGMLIYDTLFGNDANMQPKPQMVDTYDITEDKLVYTFTLRDNLKFHDGSPVTSKDVIASLIRWGKKDGVGQRLFSFVDKLEAIDDKLVTNPAISIPCGRDHSGMPFGLQVIARFRGDCELLDAAEAMEDAFARISGLGRPLPNVSRMEEAQVNLKSLVTPPPFMPRAYSRERYRAGTTTSEEDELTAGPRHARLLVGGRQRLRRWVTSVAEHMSVSEV